MRELYVAAHVKMKAALAELDRANAPGDIGAHLDLAIAKLDELLNSKRSQIAMGAVETVAK